MTIVLSSAAMGSPHCSHVTENSFRRPRAPSDVTGIVEVFLEEEEESCKEDALEVAAEKGREEGTGEEGTEYWRVEEREERHEGELEEKE